MVSNFEDKLGKKIDASDGIYPWLILYAGAILNRFSVAKDEKTPHERPRGRKSKKLMMEFGEALHFVPVNALDKPTSDKMLIC